VPATASSVCLVAIVKDEAAIIRRCLDSCRGLIDGYSIVDTGSTDGTQDLIRGHDIPGDLYEREWVNFGVNRSQALELARGKADYLLLLDADMTVEFNGHQHYVLEADMYMLRIPDGAYEYRLGCLVRGDRQWRSVGATHEYTTSADGPTTRANLDEIVIHHHCDGAARPVKFLRDLQLLREEFERDPGNVRTVYYLANTLRDLGLKEEAADMYRERAEMGGWDEECFDAMLQAGMLADDTDMLLKAWSFRPTRAEPLYELSWRLRKQELYPAAYLMAERGLRIWMPPDTLWLKNWVYEWGMKFEASISAYWVGERARALQLCDELLAERSLPDAYRQQVEANRIFCVA
jgi:tetratricopeptide (TPR) repeat protein